MCLAGGIDIAKEVHWATAVDEAGPVVLDRRVRGRVRRIPADCFVVGPHEPGRARTLLRRRSSVPDPLAGPKQSFAG